MWLEIAVWALIIACLVKGFFWAMDNIPAFKKVMCIILVVVVGYFLLQWLLVCISNETVRTWSIIGIIIVVICAMFSD